MNARLAAVAGVVVALAAAGSLAAALTAIPAGNLVKNPGAEGGPGATSTSTPAPTTVPPSWEWQTVPPRQGSDVGFVAARYGSHPYFPSTAVAKAIGGGRNFFWAGYPPQRSTAFQTIDVARAAEEIDGGGVKACLSGYLGSLRKNPDSSIAMALEFLREDGSRLGQLAVAPVRGATLSETTMLRRAAQGAVPRSTRQLRVVLTGQRPVSGGAIYGYADNVSVALTRGACDPVLSARCTGGALVATVTPSDIARTQRVRFLVRGASGQRVVNDARAPFSARVPMSGLTGRLKVTATVTQAGSGPITLTKKSRRC
ncbi:MAG TPA: hypothetical protein VLA22_11020 [Gaiellaceae bacterium]|nr:hypothetical protein [Gaiellaceae bacterium]